MALLARHILCALLVLAAVPGVGARATAQPGTIADDVKAAFLYHFTKYVDWPATAFQDGAEPFRLCVLADREFIKAVQTLVAGETARGRSLQLFRPELADVPRCHMLYIGGTSAARAASVLAACVGRPVLTVGDSPTFLEQGGAIRLVLDENRVRFDVDLRAARNAGLGISSKLLRVARNVREIEAR